MEINYKELDGLCRQKIDLYEEKVAIAWDNIDKWRCPLDQAFPELYDEITEVVDDYIEDNDLDYDEFYEEFDIEEVIGA
jgi:hypothetical protein